MSAGHERIYRQLIMGTMVNVARDISLYDEFEGQVSVTHGLSLRTVARSLASRENRNWVTIHPQLILLDMSVHSSNRVFSGAWRSRVHLACAGRIFVQSGAIGAARFEVYQRHTLLREPHAPPLPEGSRYARVGVEVGVRVNDSCKMCQPGIECGQTSVNPPLFR